ncbi:MAG: NUDIX domain-containing protein, partial [Sphingomonadales bacterium]|nr:NUDIX domain-containing protein [Sphingomonadales bacterium]
MTQTSKPTPIQAVSAVIIKNDAVLLVKRGKPPLMNSWHLPGGKVEDGENGKDAIAREVHEETGLTFHSPILLGEAIVSGNEDKKPYHYA